MQKLFSIYDKKGQVYSNPSFFPNKSVALRALGELVNDGQSSVSKYPNDFNVWVVGEWDDQKGELNAYKKLELLEECINMKKPETPKNG